MLLPDCEVKCVRLCSDRYAVLTDFRAERLCFDSRSP